MAGLLIHRKMTEVHLTREHGGDSVKKNGLNLYSIIRVLSSTKGRFVSWQTLTNQIAGIIPHD